MLKISAFSFNPYRYLYFKDNAQIIDEATTMKLQSMKVRFMKALINSILLLACLSSGGVFAYCDSNTIATTPDSEFTDNGDGTVTHHETGLMWKQCPEGLSGASCATGTVTSYSWSLALQQSEGLNAGGGFAGYTDWRVPNKKELRSIVELQCAFPSINENYFPNMSSGSFYYWTASTDPNSVNKALMVLFSIGLDYSYFKSSSYDVILVRGGR